MRKKPVNTHKSSSKNATAPRHKQIRNLVRMAKAGSLLFAPVTAEVHSDLGFISISPPTYRDNYLVPSTKETKSDLNRYLDPNIRTGMNRANRIVSQGVMSESKSEKKKIRQVSAAIHEIYMEEHNEIEAFTNYIPAHLRNQKK